MENLIRSIPENLTLNIDLSKIKISKIFKWIKSNNISDKEMMKHLIVALGFINITVKNINKIRKIFTKQYMLYEISYILEKIRDSNYLIPLNGKKKYFIFVSGKGSKI